MGRHLSIFDWQRQCVAFVRQLSILDSKSIYEHRCCVASRCASRSVCTCIGLSTTFDCHKVTYAVVALALTQSYGKHLRYMHTHVHVWGFYGMGQHAILPNVNYTQTKCTRKRKLTLLGMSDFLCRVFHRYSPIFAISRTRDVSMLPSCTAFSVRWNHERHFECLHCCAVHANYYKHHALNVGQPDICDTCLLPLITASAVVVSTTALDRYNCFIVVSWITSLCN